MENSALYSRRVWVENELIEATIFVSEEKIVSVDRGRVIKENFHFRDYGNHVIMPGLIDAHVHINEPGRTEWEGFDTATRAAAAGGITTLVDMPLNSTPVTINRDAFQKKIIATGSHLHVNTAFWGGLIPQSVGELDELLSAGVQGIKIFLTHSGIDEFPNVTEDDLHKVASILKKHDALLLAHCELDGQNDGYETLKKNPMSYTAYLQSRPREWEDRAIAMMIRFCETYHIRTHIVHLSSSHSLDQIKTAKQKGLPLSVETCPHYLIFEAAQIPDGNTTFKCAPPIREKENNEKLWQALADGIIDFVVTDHSPAPPEIKELESGNFQKAWGGIAGLQFSLPAFWTTAREKGFDIGSIASRMSTNIAQFLQLGHQKGKLKPGYDADIVVWNPEEHFEVTEEIIQHRHKVTPYLGMDLFGKIISTYVNGNLVFDNASFITLSKGKKLFKK